MLGNSMTASKHTNRIANNTGVDHGKVLEAIT